MNNVMRKVMAGVCAVGCLTVVGVSVAGATGTTTTTTTVPPFSNGNKYMSVSVDTVVGSGSPAGSVTSGGCGLENVFGQGATVVFRMWGTDNASGTPLVGAPGVKPNVASVTIQDLPGVTTNPSMSYSASDGYWTYGWKTTTSTPTGVVPYKVVVTLNPVNAVYKNVRVSVVNVVNGVKKVTHKVVKVLISETQKAERYTYTETGLAGTSLLTINPAA